MASSPARSRPPASLRRRWGNVSRSDDDEVRCPLWDSWSGAPPETEAVLDEEVHGPMLQALQVNATEQFDELAHGEMLRELWRASGFQSEYTRYSERWITLGFQTEDPARDLRGAGALGYASRDSTRHSTQRREPALAEPPLPLADSVSCYGLPRAAAWASPGASRRSARRRTARRRSPSPRRRST